ncbi:hypothetical protein F4677DRAFT_123042 [Hypoxylon crocopeplum]|nr:hypothetical protein F4677DRAFT_123042 [Hypoxylon crocopeplum]
MASESDILSALAAYREVYTSAILQGLELIECPTGIWMLPRNFEIVMQHVDALEGPGWRQLRDHSERLIFWEGWGLPGNFENADQVRERCNTGQEITQSTVGLDEEYDVAGGWACGTGNESTCYIMYGRPKGASDQGWSWHYVAHLGQFRMKVFDDVTTVLDWYQRNTEPTERDFIVTAEEVFEP